MWTTPHFEFGLNTERNEILLSSQMPRCSSKTVYNLVFIMLLGYRSGFYVLLAIIVSNLGPTRSAWINRIP